MIMTRKYRPTHKSMRMRRDAVINTVLIVAGIYVTFFVMILTGNHPDIFDEFVSTQATLSGLYVNALAVISVTYGKFAAMDLIRVSTYFISVFALFVVMNIFAQALYMQNPTIWSTWCWLRSPFVTIVLQVLLVASIYMISCQKEVEYKKNKIR